MALLPVVFVTGVPRCGSSWVGEVLSTARRVRYNYEPFNPTRHPYLTKHHAYLAAGDDDPLLRRAANAAAAGRLRFHQVLRGCRWGYGWRTIRPADQVLIKDPTAMFLAEWIEANYQARVLVILRHPCAFASSIHRLGWPANVSGFLDQPRLMSDWLAPYESLLRESQPDFWRRVAAFWGAAYTVLHGQALRHPQWRVVQYEDLCVHPENRFGELFHSLDLVATRATHRTIEKSTTKKHPHAKSTQRDSRGMVNVWRDRLTAGQIRTVLEVVEAFDLPYYRGASADQ